MFLTNQAPLGSNEGPCSSSLISAGRYAWLEGYSGKDEGNGVLSFQVPKGECYLSAIYRISDSLTAFQTKHLDLDDSLTVEIFLKDYPRGWNNGVYYELTELLTPADTTGFEIFLIGNHDQEISIRLAEMLRSLGGNSSGWVTNRRRNPLPIMW